MSTLDDWVSSPEGLSLDEQDAGMGPTEWPACRYPERRFDDNTVLHDCCPACLLALRVAVRVGHASNRDYGGGDTIASLTECLERLGPAPRSAVADA